MQAGGFTPQQIQYLMRLKAMGIRLPPQLEQQLMVAQIKAQQPLSYEEYLRQTGRSPQQGQSQGGGAGIESILGGAATSAASKYGGEYLSNLGSKTPSASPAAKPTSPSPLQTTPGQYMTPINSQTMTPAPRAPGPPSTPSGQYSTPVTGNVVPGSQGANGGAMTGALTRTNGTVAIAPGTQPPKGWSQIGTNADGTKIIKPDTPQAEAGFMDAYGRPIQGIAAVVAAYNAYNQLKEGEYLEGGLSAAQAGLSGAQAAGYAVPGWAQGALTAANTGVAMHKTRTSDDLSAEQKATRMQQQVGLAFGDWFTGGLASAAEGMLRKNKTTGKWLGKLDKLDAKTNPVTMLTKHLMHESTRYTQKKHTKELLEKAQELKNPTYMNFLTGMREQHQHKPKGPSKPYHGGEYATWDEYKKAGLDPEDLTGVYGVLRSPFAPEWAGLSHNQRVAATKRFIDADLFESKRGEVEFTDENRAREIFEQAKRENFSMPASAPVNATMATDGSWVTKPANIPSAAVIARSRTQSPGIGKDGKRINYSNQRVRR